jgi:hypothetical protein
MPTLSASIWKDHVPFRFNHASRISKGRGYSGLGITVSGLCICFEPLHYGLARSLRSDVSAGKETLTVITHGETRPS